MGPSRGYYLSEEVLRSWRWLCKGSLLQLPLVPSSSELGPRALGSTVRPCTSSTGVGRRRERLLACPFHADFFPSQSQLQLQMLATACWISPERCVGVDRRTCRLTSCFPRGNCCSRYRAVPQSFGVFPWLPPSPRQLVPVC